ncbi:MAG: hypothetical protein HQK65_10640 [Desulfamplus sp.]|nr:hypothetical protein [Desulfamplus sp.]
MEKMLENMIEKIEQVERLTESEAETEIEYEICRHEKEYWLCDRAQRRSHQMWFDYAHPCRFALCSIGDEDIQCVAEGYRRALESKINGKEKELT